MATNQNTEIEEGIVVESTAGKLENFFEENQKVVFGVLGGIIIAIAVYVGYQRFVMAPKEIAAQEAVFYAQNWFAAGEFQKALEGDGANYGFYEIIDDYKSTKVGKAAKFYAGTCELNLGNYDEAIAYLSKFKTKDANVQALAYSRLGDAYAQLENVADAAKEYKKAATTSTLDEFTANYYYKAAMAYEYAEDLANAAAMYKEITTIYPNTNDFTLTAAAQKVAKAGHLNYARLTTASN
jgi:tetratricopeptide (TPR) repeat protein